MGRIRKSYLPAFKAKVALEAIKEEETMVECKYIWSSSYSDKKVEKAALEGVVELFKDGKRREAEEKNLLIEELYKQIGQLNVELDSS